jgi:hypothetical protein
MFSLAPAPAFMVILNIIGKCNTKIYRREVIRQHFNLYFQLKLATKSSVNNESIFNAMEISWEGKINLGDALYHNVIYALTHYIFPILIIVFEY